MARPKEFDRDTALRNAMYLFWYKGYEGTSISDLTEVMEISRSSMYETFGDKQALFIEALTHYLQLNGQKRDTVLKNAISVKQGLQDFFNGVISFVLNADHPNGCFFTNTATSLGTLHENVHTIIKLAAEQRENSFYAFFERGQSSGEIKSDKNIRALARFFEGLVRGISVAANVHKDREVLEDMVKVAFEVLD
ncbi:MAG: transcriptional regulator, TetR family [Firmicutes bacterium]|nr:transcriptional regulator, TetR family [Bacillota bacterium]